MPADLTTDQVVYFVVLIVAFGVLLTERLRNDIVAVLIILALYLTGLLNSKAALSGFSSEPAIVVAGIFILSKGLHQTGVSEFIGNQISRLAGSSYSRAIAVIMPSVALLSAFTHHLTTTAVMLPVTLGLSRERDIAPSKLLMPLSFAASLGTTITIIGAPAFLLASSALQQAGRPGLGIFSIAPIGLALSLGGTVLMLLVGRFLLPERKGSGDTNQHFQLGEYLTEITVLPRSPFEGRTIADVEGDRSYSLDVEGIVREGQRLGDADGGRELQAGDILLVRTSPDQIATIRHASNLELAPVKRYETELENGNGKEDDPSEQFVQAVLAPRSEFEGRSLSEINFRRRFGAVVVGISRQSSRLREQLDRVKLRGGDVLVLQGDEDALERVANHRAFLMLVPFHGETRPLTKAPVAAAIMLATIVAAVTNFMTIEMAMVAGAVAMVLTRCVTAPQAYRAIDQRIFVFIAGAIPLGVAMQETGSSEVLGGWLQRAVGGWNQILILLAIFGVVGVLTQFMSDSATTAVFAPVAIALAQGIGHAPEPYVVTVAMAAVASFLTPIGHHGNLLVYSPGGYRFADFVRAGAPLTILAAIIVAVLAPLLWS